MAKDTISGFFPFDNANLSIVISYFQKLIVSAYIISAKLQKNRDSKKEKITQRFSFGKLL